MADNDIINGSKKYPIKGRAIAREPGLEISFYLWDIKL